MAEVPVDPVEIELSCTDCGKELEAEYWKGEILVTPCPFCLEEEFQRGRDD